MTKKDPKLFNRHDLKTVAKTTKLTNVVMQRIGKYLTGKEITVTVKDGEEIKRITSLKHYDLDKVIKFFESIENLDARKHAKNSRKKVLGLLRALKEERVEALNKKRDKDD